MEVTSYIGNSAVLELTAPPGYLTETEADNIIADNWDWLEPRCAALVFFVSQIYNNNCGCACSDGSVTSGGSLYQAGDGTCPCYGDPDANPGGTLSISVCGAG